MIKIFLPLILSLMPILTFAMPPEPVQSADRDIFKITNIVSQKIEVQFKGWNKGDAVLMGYHLPRINNAACPAERSRGINAHIQMYEQVFLLGKRVNVVKRRSVPRKGFNYAVALTVDDVLLGDVLVNFGLAVKKEPGVPKPDWCL